MCRARPGRGGAELVSVEAKDSGFVVDFGASDVGCRVAFEDAFGVAVPVEAAEGGESSGDGGSHASVGFHVSGEGLEVGAFDVEEPDADVGAPGDELAEVGGVADAGGAV